MGGLERWGGGARVKTNFPNCVDGLHSYDWWRKMCFAKRLVSPPFLLLLLWAHGSAYWGVYTPHFFCRVFFSTLLHSTIHLWTVSPDCTSHGLSRLLFSFWTPSCCLNMCIYICLLSAYWDISVCSYTHYRPVYALSFRMMTMISFSWKRCKRRRFFQLPTFFFFHFSWKVFPFFLRLPRHLLRSSHEAIWSLWCTYTGCTLQGG